MAHATIVNLEKGGEMVPLMPENQNEDEYKISFTNEVEYAVQSKIREVDKNNTKINTNELLILFQENITQEIWTNQNIDQPGLTAVLIAARGGNVDQMAFVLKNLKDLKNHPDGPKVIEDLKKILLSHEDDFNLALSSGWTPLHVASYYADAHILRLLLDYGANLHRHDANEMTAFDIVGGGIHSGFSIEPDNFTDCITMFIHRDCQKNIKKHVEFPTPLHNALLVNSLEGVKLLVKSGYPVNWSNKHGGAPIHVCVYLKNEECLKILINGTCDDSCTSNPIEVRDEYQRTVLHVTIQENWKPGVRIALRAGANMAAKDRRGDTAIHYAATIDNQEILEEILILAPKNVIDTVNHCNETPLFKAVQNGRTEVVRKLLEENASIEGTDINGRNIMHIAAMKGQSNIFQTLFHYDERVTKNMIKNDASIMNAAIDGGNIDILINIIKNSTKFSIKNFTDIMNLSAKPIESMKAIFDQYIVACNLNKQDPLYEVTVDYSVLLADANETDHMNFIKTLIALESKRSEQRLLAHPLIESFLHFKWNAILPIFLVMFTVYGLFVATLSINILSIFYKDFNNIPAILNATVWRSLLTVSVIMVTVQELLYALNLEWRSYFRTLENWIKLSSILLSVVLLVTNTATVDSSVEWTRHVATLAVLLSWLEFMLLLSRFPPLGYIVPMFGNVAFSVIKILMLFVTLLFGFSISFLLQFNGKEPFQDPWLALVKTFVMMTSEFDYSDIMKRDTASSCFPSIIVVQLIFIIFVIFISIVLVNLMLSIAVNDLHDLKKKGRIIISEKQVEVIGSMDLFYKKPIFKLLLPNKIKHILKSYTDKTRHIVLKPNQLDKSNEKLPLYLRNALCEIGCQPKETYYQSEQNINKSLVSKRDESIKGFKDSNNRNIEKEDSNYRNDKMLSMTFKEVVKKAINQNRYKNNEADRNVDNMIKEVIGNIIHDHDKRSAKKIETVFNQIDSLIQRTNRSETELTKIQTLFSEINSKLDVIVQANFK